MNQVQMERRDDRLVRRSDIRHIGWPLGQHAEYVRPAHVFSMLTQGPTYVANIGSPDEAIVSSLHLNLIHARDFAPLIGTRPADSNKGLYGHVLVVGGSVGKA